MPSSSRSRPVDDAPAAVCMVVTLASATSRYGGPFDVAREQAALLASAGIEVELVAGFTHGDRPATRPGEHLQPVGRWLPTRDFTAMLSFSMVRALWAAVGRADVVHVSFAREAIPVLATSIALIRRKPVVAQAHGMLTARSSRAHALLDRLLRPLLRRVDEWIALTEVETRALRERFGPVVRRVTAVGNPVAVDRAEVDRILAEHPEPEPSAVFVARLHPRKRVLDFAAAARAAGRRGLPEHYRVHGPDQGDLAALLRHVEAVPGLSYGGKVDSERIPDFLASNGAFVLTSDAEPWGNVLATAVTLGVPVVITRSSALAETLQDDPGVFVVDDGDVEAIATAVHEAVQGGRVPPSTRFDRLAMREALIAVLGSAMRAKRLPLAVPSPAVP